MKGVFFYFTKPERRIIICLLAVLAFQVAAGLWIHRYHTDIAVPDSEADSFVVRMEPDRQERRAFPSAGPTAEPVVRHPFDPNTADSAMLRTLGLPAFVVHNILKYRAKGGVFRTSESFSRIYGLDRKQYMDLEPYIVIGESFRKRKRKDSTETAATLPPLQDPLFNYVPKYPEGTVVELNGADTSALKRVPGIGSGLARMIVAYRERLGGFHEVTQLQEIPHVGAEVNRWFEIGGDSLRKLQVNRETLDRLRAHPYMDFYKAKAIIEYRRRRGKLEGVSRLALFEEFSEEDLKRLEPYLSFE